MGLLTKLPRWATGVTAGITEPLEGKKDIGWVASEKPPAQYFNWILKTIYDGMVVLDGLAGAAMTWTAQHAFQAAVTMAQTLVATGKITANGAIDLKGALSLIDLADQAILKGGTGNLDIGTALNAFLYLKVNGTRAWAVHPTTGELLSVGSNRKISSVADPTGSQDAATKGYVDGIQFAAPSMITPTLGANWSQGTPAGNNLVYWKDRTGVVHLRGDVLAGAGAANPVFTLPVGYRPTGNRYFASVDYNGGVLTFGGMSVVMDGTVYITTPITAGHLYFFDNLTFLAEQ
jgi:hypothetical protein